MSSIHLSENIIRLRREKGITQEELAKFIGVTKASVSKWETKLSLPDILLLPKLAAFFDVTVDSLIGYEPQLGKEQIQACYRRLAAEFAEKPFEEVMTECESLVKQYYACYPFLLQICVLWLNHFMLAADRKRQQEVLAQGELLCTRIIKECKSLLICSNAVSLKAMFALQGGKAAEIVADLEDIQNVNNIQDDEMLLVQAFLLTGDWEKADKAAQVHMYRSVMNVFGSGLQLMQIQGQDQEKCGRIMSRMDALVETFALERLNPNAAAGYQYQAALLLAGYGRVEAAFARLESYVRAVKNLFQQDIRLHGDEFFDRLDEWMANGSLGAETVRNRKLIAKSAIEAFEHPILQALPDKKRINKLRFETERICGSRGNENA